MKDARKAKATVLFIVLVPAIGNERDAVKEKVNCPKHILSTPISPCFISAANLRERHQTSLRNQTCLKSLATADSQDHTFKRCRRNPVGQDNEQSSRNFSDARSHLCRCVECRYPRSRHDRCPSSLGLNLG